MSSSQVMPRPASIDTLRTGTPATLDVRKALYLRWIKELWAGRSVAREIVSDDFVGHWPTHDVHGPEQLEGAIATARTVLKDLSFVVEVGPFADGDLVSARWIATGSDLRGPARYVGNDILRVSGARIVEYWNGTSRG